MLFTVEQNGLFSFPLLWEFSRVLGRSRRKTLRGKLMLVPGIWVLMMGLTFTVGMLASDWEAFTEDEALGMVLMVPLTLFLLLWGISWCGLLRLPAALTRLLRVRRAEIITRFYLNYAEDVWDMVHTNYPYETVRDVYEGRQAFFLQLEGGGFLILQKSCFTTGEPGAFRRWMDKKGGKPVIKL